MFESAGLPMRYSRHSSLGFERDCPNCTSSPYDRGESVELVQLRPGVSSAIHYVVIIEVSSLFQDAFCRFLVASLVLPTPSQCFSLIQDG
jgi:hypothetical protein